MNRRRFLLSAGSVATLGLLNRSSYSDPTPLTIKIWVTEAATAYPSCRRRSVEYLRPALASARPDVSFSFGRQPVSVAGDDRYVERIDWPRQVLAGAAGAGPIDPVADVNLLLTDGSITDSSVGYAYDHIATVPGARYLASMPAADSVPSVVDYSQSAAVVQLLLHEVGHALGLGHQHGSVVASSGHVTVSPMVSGYAWAPAAVQAAELPAETCTEPHTELPPRIDTATDSPADSSPNGGMGRVNDEPTDSGSAAGRDRRLSFAFSPCAERAIRAYPRRRVP